jgi:methyl-accepting chemotaxis protein
MIAFTFVVTALALLALAVPLALDVRSRIRIQERSALAKLAAVAAADIGATPRLGSDPIELPESSTGSTTLGVYAPDARRLAGTGPTRLDLTAAAFKSGGVTELAVKGQLVVAIPILVDERLTAVVRAAEPEDVLSDATRAAWLRIAFAALAALTVATGFAALVAKRLLRPLNLLHDRANRLGSGEVDDAWTKSGLVEIDTIAAALQESASRVDASLTRERAFSADVSHQLRTPVTGLKVTLETELEHPRPDATLALTEALRDVEVLETKIETMLTLARDTMTVGCLRRHERHRPQAATHGLTVRRAVALSESARGHVLSTRRV